MQLTLWKFSSWQDTEFDPGNSRDSFHVTGSMKRKSQSPINYSMEKRFMFDTKVEPSEESNPFKLKIYVSPFFCTLIQQ